MSDVTRTRVVVDHEGEYLFPHVELVDPQADGTNGHVAEYAVIEGLKFHTPINEPVKIEAAGEGLTKVTMSFFARSISVQ